MRREKREKTEPDRTAGWPIEDLAPEWIGLAMEVEDAGGTTIGFRLGRYEKTEADSQPVWRLFSDHPAWSVTVHAGTRLRFARQPSGPPAHTGHYPPEDPAAGSSGAQLPPPPPPGPPRAPARNPQSWVTPPGRP